MTWVAATANGTTVTGYEVQYRKQVAAGEDPAAWTDYTYTNSDDEETTVLPASTRTVNLARPRGGRHLRGAGARRQQRGGRRGLVRHRVGAGEHGRPTASTLSLSDATVDMEEVPPTTT